MDEASPLGLFLVKSGSKGDRLLFRYPYGADDHKESYGKKKRKNPYTLVIDGKDDLSAARHVNFCESNECGLFGFDDKILSNLFAVKPELCGQKFELKVENVRFVGHPTLLTHASNREPSTILMFNIVFALKANASHSIVNCYHDLSHRLSIAIQHEERRCSYLTSQVKLMLTAHDEVAALPEDCEESPFNLILSKSQLALDLKTAYEDFSHEYTIIACSDFNLVDYLYSLKNSGTVHLKIHKWIEVSFCLPNKVHHLHNKNLAIEPESIQNSLKALRPYHGILLLVDANELVECLPEDASPSLIRLIRITSPLKNLQQLAADADLVLSHVFQLVGHLVYWAKATIIYPLCDNNVYVLSPNAPTHINSPLVEMFSERFQGMSLLAVLSQFSLPISLSNLASPMNLPYQQTQQVQMVAWMLQHRLLMQLHTYVYLVPTDQSSSLLTSDNRRHSDDLLLQGKGASSSDFGSSFPSEESLTVSPGHSENHSKSGSEEDLSLRDQDYSLLANLTTAERNSILKDAAASNNDDLKTFIRLCPYFKGCHHLEEIMYCENIRRSQLLALLDKFRNVLITCQYEDSAVAAFYKHT